MTSVIPTTVTLVHGTFATGAPWTQDNSALRQALSDALGPSTTFNPFSWSGENSFIGRAEAVEHLRSDLKRSMGRADGGRHIVIGHSHGGNVVLKALEDSTISEHVEAVVCMSTPFIVARPREFGDHSKFILGMAKVMWCLVAGALVAWPVFAVDGQHEAGWRGIATLLLALVGGLASWYAMSKVGAAWKRRAYEWATTVTVRAPGSPTRLLIVRPAADEATEGLSALHLPVALTTHAWKALAWIASVPLYAAAWADHWASGRVYRRLVTGLGLWLVGAAWTLGLYPDAPSDRKEVLLIYLAAVLFVSALVSTEVGLLRLVAFIATPIFLVLGTVYIVLLLALSLVALPFNTSFRGAWAFARTAFWLGPIDLSAEHGVPGNSEISIRVLNADAPTGLRHSAPYEDPVALAWISEFVRPKAQP